MLEKIVSGGQTGVDRAALDAALALGIPCAGWCPRGRRAEDGEIPRRYPLRETPLPNYEQRTEWNVRDSDATLVLVRGRPAGGTRLAIDATEAHGKPCRVVVLGDPDRVLARFEADWADMLGVSRARTDPGAEAPTVVVNDLRKEPRCDRCWKRVVTAAVRADGATLCDRCAEAVGG